MSSAIENRWNRNQRGEFLLCLSTDPDPVDIAAPSAK
jgi:hypothetical protein